MLLSSSDSAPADKLIMQHAVFETVEY